MKKFGLLLSAMMIAGTSTMHAQMDNSIKINEVLTNNTVSLQDEYGKHEAWIEIANISFSTYDIRGMYLTTDRSVLDRKMSVQERVKRMSIVPNDESRTKLTARQHLVFYANSQPTLGALHLSLKIDANKPTWIGLYNGNAVDLVDSVTVPTLGVNMSYARASDGAKEWQTKSPEFVTGGISNVYKVSESKVAKVKREDPSGFGITALSMGIVFFCLALLWIFFTIFGTIMEHREAAAKMANKQPIKPITKTVAKTVEIGHKTNVILQDGLKSKGIDKEIYMAVIGMALSQYEDNVHDVESGIITIKEKSTDWNDEYIQMTQFHE